MQGPEGVIYDKMYCDAKSRSFSCFMCGTTSETFLAMQGHWLFTCGRWRKEAFLKPCDVGAAHFSSMQANAKEEQRAGETKRQRPDDARGGGGGDRGAKVGVLADMAELIKAENDYDTVVKADRHNHGKGAGPP